MDRSQHVGKALSLCPPGTSGVLTSRTENGRKIELLTKEQVFNDAVDRGLIVEDADSWLKRVAANTPPTFSFPPHVNSTDFIEIENQGSIGSCFGVSGASVADWLYWIKTGKVRRFSGFLHYLWTQMQDNLLGKDAGSVPTSGWKVAQKIGHVPEDEIEKRLPVQAVKRWGGVYPPSYREGLTAYRPLLRDPKIREIASEFVVRSIVVLKKTDQVVDYIRAGQGGVQQCSPWKKPFDAPGNRVTSYHGSNRQGMHGHHAYYISGFNQDREPNLTNSWSERYGDEGGKTIDRRAEQDCLDDRQTYCVGMSDMAVSSSNAPRRIEIKTEDFF